MRELKVRSKQVDRVKFNLLWIREKAVELLTDFDRDLGKLSDKQVAQIDRALEVASGLLYCLEDLSDHQSSIDRRWYPPTEVGASVSSKEKK